MYSLSSVSASVDSGGGTEVPVSVFSFEIEGFLELVDLFSPTTKITTTLTKWSENSSEAAALSGSCDGIPPSFILPVTYSGVLNSITGKCQNATRMKGSFWVKNEAIQMLHIDLRLPIESVRISLLLHLGGNKKVTICRDSSLNRHHASRRKTKEGRGYRSLG
ncbi:hypothetical protein [Streptomyces sp. NPDC101165]|uniref:hypothetical protein n=1 Tax=Streptomyces sp. NPDC101165 TaxID=3366119 RepID=UPI003808CF68